jgi:hypothetical protein
MLEKDSMLRIDKELRRFELQLAGALKIQLKRTCKPALVATTAGFFSPVVNRN